MAQDLRDECKSEQPLAMDGLTDNAPIVSGIGEIFCMRKDSSLLACFMGKIGA